MRSKDTRQSKFMKKLSKTVQTINLIKQVRKKKKKKDDKVNTLSLATNTAISQRARKISSYTVYHPPTPFFEEGYASKH